MNPNAFQEDAKVPFPCILWTDYILMFKVGAPDKMTAAVHPSLCKDFTV